MRLPPVTAAALALALAFTMSAAVPQAAKAQTAQDQQVWLNLTAMGPVAGDLVYFAEVQPRSGDSLSRLDQLLLRGAVGWKVSGDLTLYQGYAHVAVPVEGGRDVNEERAFQQVNANLGRPWGGELSSRTRLEQRWRSDGSDTGWRLREMLRYEKPLRSGQRTMNALVSVEGFVALNDTDWGARSGFDQVRSFAGMELGLAGASTAEIGYLNQVIDRAGGRTRMNHVASLSLFWRR